MTTVIIIGIVCGILWVYLKTKEDWDNMIEKYAREKYFMKKDSEDIYIIEFEEDKIKDSLLEAEQ